MEETPKRSRGRPKRDREDWDIQIWVRVGQQLKHALAEYAKRHSFPNDAEAIRDILRTRFKEEGLL
jgi:hypothetical protein